jgi:hypothetical protein
MPRQSHANGGRRELVVAQHRCAEHAADRLRRFAGAQGAGVVQHLLHFAMVDALRLGSAMQSPALTSEVSLLERPATGIILVTSGSPMHQNSMRAEPFVSSVSW